MNIQSKYQSFNQPLALEHAGDENIYVVEKEGTIIVINTITGLRSTYLDIKNKVSTNANERGLLGLAFDPDFQNNGHFFVNYTNNSGNTVISRFSNSTDANEADPDSELIIMVQSQPYSNHNGGCIKFGPDGYLYIGHGDGGSAGDPQNFAQNPQSFLGKMLRIDVSSSTSTEPYSIPADNPFVGDASTLDEIWALGLRNPWRFSFDKHTGDLWIGDVGQNEWEEIHHIAAGDNGPHNFGWRCYEGDAPYNTSGCLDASEYEFPVLTYNNNNTEGCSVTGGYVYRSCAYPNLYGHYLYIDYCSGRLWGADTEGSGDLESVQLGNIQNFNFASLGEDASGNLYLIGLADGTIYTIGDLSESISYELITEDISCDKATLGSISLESSQDSNFWTQLNWSNGSSNELSISELSAGQYNLEATGANGCSMMLFSSLIHPSIGNTTPELNFNTAGDSLLVNDEYDNYQWYINGDLVSGANSNIIRISASGNYTVEIWNEDRPDCVLAVNQDIISSSEELDNEQTVRPYPNPFTNFLQLEAKDLKQISQIQIVDLKGKTVYESTGKDIEQKIETTEWSSGIYFMIIHRTDQKKTIKKLVK